MPKRVGSSAVKMTSSIERRGLKPSCCRTRMASSPPSTPTHAVVEAGVRNRIDVRAGCDGSEIGFAASPAREGIADGVFVHFESGFAAETFRHKHAREGRPH